MNTVNAVIETPKGSNQKYNYDPKTGFFIFKKSLPAGMVFPYDFGFIPGTKGEDGDPLDIVIIAEFKSFPGCMMECNLIGCIQAEQSEDSNSKTLISNDRFIGIPVESTMFKKIKSIGDIPSEILTQIQNFFINYNKEEGKIFKVKKKIDGNQAIRKIKYTQ